MGFVVKKGGKKQAFNANKIRKSIEKAGKEAKLTSSKVKELVKEVGEPAIKYYKNKRTVRASDLRKSLLGRLDRRAKKVSAAWRRHDKRKKK